MRDIIKKKDELIKELCDVLKEVVCRVHFRPEDKWLEEKALKVFRKAGGNQ